MPFFRLNTSVYVIFMLPVMFCTYNKTLIRLNINQEVEADDEEREELEEESENDSEEDNEVQLS